MAIIKRTFTFLNKIVLISVYRDLVGPHLEYDDVIWYPCLKRLSAAVEKDQRKAKDLEKENCHFHYEDRLRYLDLPTLKMRRMRGDLIQTNGIFHKTVDLQS